MKIQTRALKCRQAILKGIRDISHCGVEKTRRDNCRHPLLYGNCRHKIQGRRHGTMGKNLGGSVMLFLVPKIVETLITWAAK